MKRFGGVLLTCGGVVLILLGLLFLVGAGGQARRLAVAAVGLALGAVATGVGVLMVKRVQSASPEQVRTELLALARQGTGELSAADVTAALGRRAAVAREVLSTLAAEGVCEAHRSGGADYWVFPDLLPRLVAHYCDYCEAEYPISQDLSKCPSCGGTLSTRRAAQTVSAGELYGMD